jgi:GntR family transcriptional regulator
VQFAIDTADARPIDTQIVDEVHRAMVLGTLRPDDDLPPVRILAAELRVNPSAVASAYRTLEAEGVVQMRWGRGPVVAHAAPAPGDRAAIVRRVAEHALRDARRNGVTAAELADAVRALAEPQNPNGEPSR